MTEAGGARTVSERVAEKLREDIKEIQLQLAGLEIEEFRPDPAQIYRGNEGDKHLADKVADQPAEKLSQTSIENFSANLSENLSEKISDGLSGELVDRFIVETSKYDDSQLALESVVDETTETPHDAPVEAGQDERTEAFPVPLQTDVRAELIKADEKLIESVKSIPNMMGFKIGDAAELVGVKQYVLRYWESEFDQLKPKKSKNGQRMYSRRDIETAMMIKRLLYQDRFSIEGARAALKHLRADLKTEKVVAQEFDRFEQTQAKVLQEAQKLLERIRASKANLASMGQ